MKNILDMEKEFSEGNMTPTSIHFAILVNNTAGISENFRFKKTLRFKKSEESLY